MTDKEHIHHALLRVAINQYSSQTVKSGQNISVYFLGGGAGFSYVNHQPSSGGGHKFESENGRLKIFSFPAVMQNGAVQLIF